MGKITVKHYLNKRVMPLVFGDEKEYYPIYAQITYGRKTTQIKSFTDIFITEYGLQKYTETNVLDAAEIFTIGQCDVISSLVNETRMIEAGIKFIADKEIDISNKGDVREILETLFMSMKSILIYHYKLWIRLDRFNTEYDFTIYDALNPEQTISTNINKIKDKTKIDLAPFVDKTYLDLSKDIDTFIQYIGANTSYIDFVNSEYNLANVPNLKNRETFSKYLTHTLDVHIVDYMYDKE